MSGESWDYCCCCGGKVRAFYGYISLWCNDCRGHVLPAAAGLPTSERTFFAQHGKDCPHQVGGTK
jgi:hypothetical protein